MARKVALASPCQMYDEIGDDRQWRYTMEIATEFVMTRRPTTAVLISRDKRAQWGNPRRLVHGVDSERQPDERWLESVPVSG